MPWTECRICAGIGSTDPREATPERAFNREPTREHGTEREGRVSEKWIRFSALNDALIQEESIELDPKSGIHFWVRCSSTG